MNKKGFTLVEIVVTMSIMVILSTISFISYSSHITTANNTQRMADLKQLESSLLLFKKEQNRLPEPGNIKFSNEVFKQGEMTGSELNNIKKVPTDPKVKTKYYTYSKIIYPGANQEFQLAATLEGENPTAIIEGDYYPVTTTYPSIIIVRDTIDRNTIDRNNFILNESIRNTPYTFRSPYEELNTGEAIPNEEINKLIRHPFTTCDQIKKAGKFIGNADYKTNNGENSISCN